MKRIKIPYSETEKLTLLNLITENTKFNHVPKTIWKSMANLSQSDSIMLNCYPGQYEKIFPEEYDDLTSLWLQSVDSYKPESKFGSETYNLSIAVRTDDVTSTELYSRFWNLLSISINKSVLNTKVNECKLTISIDSIDDYDYTVCGYMETDKAIEIVKSLISYIENGYEPINGIDFCNFYMSKYNMKRLEP